ncbi:hypothetical protein Egran_05646 [Elaphomyces granulatus]|uniref:Putative transcription factor kapC n=1 Tax=Elaphomyces granulatus TaxID=519963 RepID=A0A232LR04_9EURO|nr:hypothetical protein Egran_05646 [Elaphomyces granulatus]
MPQALAGSSLGGVVMADKVMRWHLDLPSGPSLVRKLQPAVAESPFRLSSTIPSFRINPTDTNAESIAFQERLVATQKITPRPRSQSSLIQIGAGSTGARDQSNIDPAISGTTMLSPADPSPTATGPGGEVSPQEPGSSQEARKTYGKRELSTSKRAAQNRAAQRAFRQRKEGYIRKLEEQVKDYEVLTESYKALQAENYQLREYIIGLQSRLIDSQNEVPELPGNIDLTQPRPEPPTAGVSTSAGAAAPSSGPVALQQTAQPSTAPSSTPSDDLNQLNRIAVAGLGMRKHQHEGTSCLGESFQAKRMRTDDNSQELSPITKTEAPNGLPVVT